jgi:dienelactone hydrolase
MQHANLYACAAFAAAHQHHSSLLLLCVVYACITQRFDDMHHGFCAARGDWTNELQAKRASEAVGIVTDFFKMHLK